MTPETLKAWRARLSLGEAGMSVYLGVPVTTYRKWENGTRKPDAAPLRLFDLLQSIENLDDGGVFHRDLIREATEAENKPQKARKPRAATLAPATPEKRPSGQEIHVLGTIPAGTVVTADVVGDLMKQNPPPWIHAADALPAWMKGGV